MHIHFTSIYIKRFRSFLDEATLHFDSTGIGLYFLKGKNEAQSQLGSNGSGKSTILDGLSWCLYGKTIQGLKNTDIAPWQGKGQTIVEVTLAVDKKQHHIRRTANPNLLTIDGTETSQEYVDKLLGIPIEIMPYAIIMGQRQPLFFDLTASEKLRVFTEPLNLERWEQRSIKASEIVKELEIAIGALEIEINLQQGQAIKAEAAQKLWKEKSTEWEQERSNALKHQDKDRSNLQKMLSSIQSSYDDADLALERAETELRAINLSDLITNECAKNDVLQRLDRDIKSSEAKRRDLEDMRASLDDDTCPTCNQPIKSAKNRAALVKNVSEQLASLNIAKLMDARARAFKQHTESEAILQVQSTASKTFEQESRQARDELLRLGRQKSEFEAQIKSLDERIKEYENQNNPFNEHVKQARQQKAQIELQIAQAQKNLQGNQESCERNRFWIKGFKDIKLYCLTEILTELKLVTNGLLQEFGLVDWQIHYDVERETKAKTIARGLNITVLSGSNKEAVKWEVWSGGEAQRLRLIGSIALSNVLLNHLGISTNFMCFDEPTESLSKEGVVDLVELLANHAKEAKKNVFLIDHHLIESSLFADVITIVKDKQGSKIVLV